MALNFYELAKSRPVDRSVESISETLKFIGMYSTDENAVAAGLLAVSPTIYNTLRRQRYKLEPLGAGVWMCDVEYAWNALTQPDSPSDLNPADGTPPSNPTYTDDTNLGPEWGFDITAGQVHITQSLGTRYRWAASDAAATGNNLAVDATTATIVTPDTYVPDALDVGKTVLISGGVDDNQAWVTGSYKVVAVAGGQWRLNAAPAPIGTTGGLWSLVTDPAAIGSAPNYKQAIGVTRDRVEGTEIFAPKFEFTITASYFPLKLPYMRLIRKLCARTNAYPWGGFAVGEVVYLGATGQCAPGSVWRVTHKFAAGENLYAVPVSLDTDGKPAIVVPYKGAWEYLWTIYGPSVDANQLIEIPKAAYVEKVYRQGDFSLLGVGANG